MKASRVFFLVNLVFVCLPALARGQTTGDIDGRITGADGNPLAAGAVEVTSPRLQGTRTAVSGPDGYYRIPAAPPGEYRVTASRTGSRTIQKTTIVRLGATATVDFVLEPATTEQVLVSG